MGIWIHLENVYTVRPKRANPGWKPFSVFDIYYWDYIFSYRSLSAAEIPNQLGVWGLLTILIEGNLLITRSLSPGAYCGHKFPRIIFIENIPVSFYDYLEFGQNSIRTGMANVDPVRGQADDERTTGTTCRSRRSMAVQEIHDPWRY